MAIDKSGQVNPYTKGSENYARREAYNLATGQSPAPKSTPAPTPAPTPSPTPTKTLYSTSGKVVPGTPVVYGGFTNVGGSATLGTPTATSALQVIDKTTGESKGFIGAGGVRYSTEQQAIQSTARIVPTTTTAQREAEIAEQYARSGLDPTKVLYDPSKEGYLEASIPRTGFRYDPDLNKSILDKQSRGEALSVQEKEYVLQYSGARVTPTQDPTKSAQTQSLEEELARESEQARLEQATKDLGVNEALRDEKRLSSGEMQERQDKLAQAKSLLANMSLKGRVSDINRAIASSVVGIKEKTLASKAKVGSEIEELIRQQSNLITAVTVPDGRFFYPELMSPGEKQFAIGTEKFFVDRDKALFQQQDEFQTFLVQQQLAGVLEQGTMVGDLARELGVQEKLGVGLDSLARDYGLVSKNGFYDVEESIPSSLIGVQREGVSKSLVDLAERFEASDKKVLDLGQKLKDRDFVLSVPREEDLSRVKQPSFFGGLTKGFEEFRESVAPLEGKPSKSLVGISGISVSPFFEQKVLSARDKTLFGELSKDTSVTRFVSSFPLGVTRFGEFAEKLAGEDVALLKARLAGDVLTERDLQSISPSITGVRKLLESSSVDFTKIKSVEDFGSALTEKVQRDIGVYSTIGLSIASKIKKDPFGEIGEIVGPYVIMGGAKLGLQALKTAVTGPPLPASDIAIIAKSASSDYLRTPSKFLSQTDDISRIGYSRLEAASRRFLGVGDKTDDAIRLAAKKASVQAQKNIASLTSEKAKLVSERVSRQNYLEQLKKEILDEKLGSVDVVSKKKIFDLDYSSVRTRILVDKAKDLKSKAIQQDFAGQLARDKASLEINALVDKFVRPKAQKAIDSKFAQQKIESVWRAQDTAVKKLVKQEDLLRDLDIIKRIEAQNIQTAWKELKLEDSIRLLLKRSQFEETFGIAKEQALKASQRLGRDSLAFQKYEALSAERLNWNALKQVVLKELGKSGDDVLPSLGSVKPKPPKPPTPPVQNIVQVPQGGDTMLLQRLVSETGKELDKTRIITKPFIRSDASIIKTLTGQTPKPIERLFPKLKVIKDIPETQLVSGVQPVYGFTIPGIQKVSDSMAIRLRGFREEESELIQVARNIGVKDIPSTSDFLKYQEPAIIRTRDYTPSMVDARLQERLNERLVDVGLRNLEDTMRGVGVTRTLEDTKLVLDITTREQAILKELSDTKTLSDTMSDTMVLQDMATLSDTRVKQDYQQKQALASLLKTRLLTDLKTKTMTDSMIKTRTKTVPRTTKPIQIKLKEEFKPPKIMLPFPMFETGGEDDKKLQRLFKFYEIRGEPRGGRTTKKYLGMFPLIKGLNIGAELVGSTPSRTIKYVPTDVKARVKDDTKFKYAEKFRRPGRTTKLTGPTSARFLIEKSRYAIESPEEKKGITMKGIMARQSTARLNKSFLGLTNKNNRRVKNVRKKRRTIKRR